MAELTTADLTTTSSCCSTEAQATCCEPSEKAECCETEVTAAGSCGCADRAGVSRGLGGGRTGRC
jgi:hypothetical protein